MPDSSESSDAGDTFETADSSTESQEGNEPLPLDFYEMVDRLLLGYTNQDVHGILTHVDIPNREYDDLQDLLINIGGMAGPDGIRVAILHILLDQGKIDSDFLENLMDDAEALDGIEVD